MKIEIKGLTKSFDNTPVLNGVSLSDDINTLALIGRSGCGKSTLLRILCGLLPADSGSLTLAGDPITDTETYRKKIGYVFQQGGLFSHLSARDNITLPLIKVHNIPAEQANQTASDLLNRFGLLAQADKKPAQLSGGQRQRIAIARAIAPKPKILLLDEPTSALDPEYTTEVLDVIRELKEDNLSFIIATHEMGFAFHACEKVAFLHEGNILEYGMSQDIFKAPKTDELKAFLSKLLEWKV